MQLILQAREAQNTLKSDGIELPVNKRRRKSKFDEEGGEEVHHHMMHMAMGAKDNKPTTSNSPRRPPLSFKYARDLFSEDFETRRPYVFF